jgi:hypothetical protein
MGTQTFKKMLLATALVSTAFAGNAYAATASIGYGNTELTVVAPRPSAVTGAFTFTDLYNLTLTGPSSFSAYVSEIEKDLTFVVGGSFYTNSVYNINNTTFKFGLYDASNNLVSDTSSLLAGNYQFRVTGSATGALGGQYFIGLNVSAVPEPEMALSMLFGLAAIGAVVRRKAKTV